MQDSRDSEIRLMIPGRKLDPAWLQKIITSNIAEFIVGIINASYFCVSNGNIWIAANENICISN